MGGRELGAKLLLLYERRNELLQVAGAARIIHWRPATAAQLIASGYPGPRGDLYFVADLELIDTLPKWAHAINLESLTANTHPGGPVAVTWSDLIRATSMNESEAMG
ncbi:hypothetical protein AU184_22745 [Mycolicibacterium novocastrense]|nr:hypothetical protein AU072_24815 [Mycolicibacterium novocastrense]KUH68323.1 hypothetical protein AU184_22745 [Mycolicibacterium novocastrense]KUH73402.1 hypothetical protein AU183_23635 [Mycolicibacterium novocastrense]